MFDDLAIAKRNEIKDLEILGREGYRELSLA
jgi:hypothetical protein